MAKPTPEMVESFNRQAQQHLDAIEEKMPALMEKVFQQGITFQELLGMTNDAKEYIYSRAEGMYNAGQYKDATPIFRGLLVADSKQPKFALGLGACLHRRKEHMCAVRAYSICADLDPKNPIPLFHAADCHMREKQWPSAIKCLTEAVSRSAAQDRYAMLKERSEKLLESLRGEHHGS